MALLLNMIDNLLLIGVKIGISHFRCIIGKSVLSTMIDSLAWAQSDLPIQDPQITEARKALASLDQACDEALLRLEEDLRALRDTPKYLAFKESNDRSALRKLQKAFIQPYLDTWVPRYDALTVRFRNTPAEILVTTSRLERQVTLQPAELMEAVTLRHAENPLLVTVARRFPWAYRRIGSKRYFAMIEQVLAESSSDQVRAYAFYARAMPAIHDPDSTNQQKSAAASDLLLVKSLVPESSLLWKRAHGPEFQKTRLQLGMSVPEIEGVDLDGTPLQLSEFQGQVVVLSFWGDWCESCRNLYDEKKQLVDHMRGRPFVLIGVNSDHNLNRAQSVVKEKELNWRSFWNGEEGAGGPISSLWNVSRWPTLYVIDHEGVIRDRNKRGEELHEVVDALVLEAESIKTESSDDR